MHKNAMKCNKTLSKWCKNKHGASKIIDTFETYHSSLPTTVGSIHAPPHHGREEGDREGERERIGFGVCWERRLKGLAIHGETVAVASVPDSALPVGTGV
jgi:hypothetical protein